MRINEFADAEEQLALWKLVSDSVWTAIRAQAEQAVRAKAEKAAQVKAKRKAGGSRGGSKSSLPPSDIPMVPPPKPLPAKLTWPIKPSSLNNSANTAGPTPPKAIPTLA